MPSTQPSSASILHAASSGSAPSSRRKARADATVRCWRLGLRSARHTTRLGILLGRALRGGEVLALTGELGTGKTTLVKGVAAGLGIPPSRVSSPTFVLIQAHQGRLGLVHVDLYRLETPEQLRDLGLSDYLDGRWVLAIEWASRADAHLPHDRLTVHVQHRSPTTREAEFLAAGPRAAALLTRLVKACRKHAPSSSARRDRRER